MSVETRVLDIIANQQGIYAADVSLTSTPESLGIDSLGFIELILSVEREFDIELNDDDLSERMLIQAFLDLIFAEQ